jgi:hypothetical protein
MVEGDGGNVWRSYRVMGRIPTLIPPRVYLRGPQGGEIDGIGSLKTRTNVGGGIPYKV